MKMQFAVAIVLVALLGINSSRAADNCEQGQSYEVDCNTCTCTETGIYVCTRRACYHGPLFGDDMKCQQGHSYEDDCNTCTCISETGIYVCTTRACYDGPRIPDNVPQSIQPGRKRRQTGCDRGPSYNDGCNYCVCLNDQHYACTERACIQSDNVAIQPARNTRQTPPTCDRGPSYEQDCNTCRCIPESGIYFCTRRACLPNPAGIQAIQPLRRRREISANSRKYELANSKQTNMLSFQVERCEPSEVKNKGCNRCKCTKNGKGFLCTNNVCPKVVEPQSQ